jgi:hypothetical protein
MDVIISKFEKTKDWRILRDELNLGSGVDLENEEIFYITVQGNNPKFSFGVPVGNEPSAIVGEWIPGGYTKNGTTEAALNFCEDCIHNKDISNVLDYFGKNNCTKIK